MRARMPNLPGVTTRPVRFREGPPVAGGAKVHHLPNWGKMTDRKRVQVIERLIRSYGRDPRLRQVALDIVRKAGVQPRDYQGQAAALLSWVNQNIYYVNEPGEQLQSVWYTLRTRSGDCDDCHIILSSLAESLRLPWKTVLSGRDRQTGQRRRWISGQPMPKGVRFAHIYTLLGWPPFKPQRWMFADPSLKGSYLGWDIVGARNMPPVPGAPRELMPEMGRSPYGSMTSSMQGKRFTKPIPLKRDQVMVVQADDPKYKRGLLIDLVGRGGYDMAYWYGKPRDVYPAEVKVDGKTITKSGRIVHIGYHPELAKKSNPYGAMAVPTPEGHKCPPGYARVTGIDPVGNAVVNSCVPNDLLRARAQLDAKMVEKKVETAERAAFWSSIKWQNVVSVALPTIISGLVLASVARRK
jgi:hypothetical protein